MILTHDDYTVAWICALPLELAAAKAMLDAAHAPLPQPKTDHNVYTLGSISGHNVVLACLPSGVYGKISASTVVSHLVSTYPNIQFGLMVGIGGGVPRRVDIRLGDVVVSKPTATSPGVIQYDYGKTLRDGQFQRSGSLDKPPQVLLKAVAQLESDHMTGKGVPISTTIDNVLLRNDEMKEHFSRPKADWLFQPACYHEEDRSDCSGCDQSQVVIRSQRTKDEPHIHHGLVASGDQVMKDAITRDSIAADLDILCFEMEAAGLMDELPSLVIRGICDYCDSHKQKQWQGYAALSAAAYAKSLLCTVPNKRLENYKIGFMPEEQECLRSLFLTDPVDDRNSLMRRKGDRAAGTCEWILTTDEFKHWIEPPEHGDQKGSGVLWLHGNPGTGKSTMAITITGKLPQQTSFSDENRTLGYFFCDSSSEKQRTAVAVLRGLLYHLVQQQPTLMKYLFRKYQERKKSLYSSFDAIWAVLVAMGQDASHKIYCIIDALDECEPESQQILLSQIKQTFMGHGQNNAASSHIHLLITSRPYPEIREYLSHFKNRDLASYEAVSRDLKTMIQENVKDLAERKTYPKRVTEEVSEILEEKAEGTFLWVGIACGELARAQSRNAVKTLKKLPPGLHALYQQLLSTALANSDDNSDNDKDDDNKTIVNMLTVVAFARRPLTVPELSALCRLYLDYDVDSRLPFTKEIIDSCRLMIVIQDERVQLLHRSVKDFLIKERREINSLKAHAELTSQCINLILDLGSTTKSRKLEITFPPYETEYWPEHAALAEGEFIISPRYESFFDVKSKQWNQWLAQYNSSSKALLGSGFSAFHAAAKWAILPLLSWALRSKEGTYDDAKFETSDRWTPLQVAAQHGNINVMSILLENMKVGLTISDQVFTEAYHNPRNGNEVMEYLLEQHTDRVMITRRLIQLITYSNHAQRMMEILLDKGTSRMETAKNIIQTAAAAGNLETMKQVMETLLYQPWDNILIFNDMLGIICETFDSDIVAILLERLGNCIQITENDIKAAMRNWKSGRAVMKVILERQGYQIPITEDLLRWAVAAHEDGTRLIELLFQHGREDQLIITEDIVKTAAANWGSGKEILEFLLDRGGDHIQITENILSSAAGNLTNGKQVLELLLQRQENQITITEGVVKAAAANWMSGTKIMEFLLDQRGDDIPITEDVLKCAAANWSNGKQVIELLIQRQGDRIQITPGVIEAVENDVIDGKETIELLLNHRDTIRDNKNPKEEKLTRFHENYTALRTKTGRPPSTDDDFRAYAGY